MQQTTTKTTYTKLEAEIACMRALMSYDKMTKTMLPLDITGVICELISVSRGDLHIDFAINNKGEYYVEVTFYKPYIKIVISENALNPHTIQSRIDYLKFKIKESATA